jgi:hypothetical protein
MNRLKCFEKASAICEGSVKNIPSISSCNKSVFFPQPGNILQKLLGLRSRNFLTDLSLRNLSDFMIDLACLW